MSTNRPASRGSPHNRRPWPKWLPWLIVTFVGASFIICAGLLAFGALGWGRGVVPPRAATVKVNWGGPGPFARPPSFLVRVEAAGGFRAGEDYRLVAVGEGRSSSRGIAGFPSKEVVYPKPLGLTADASVSIDWTVEELKDYPGGFSFRIDRYVGGRSEEIVSMPARLP